MPIWMAAFFGLVQGVTEFLPVSSSGHLAIFQYLFGLNEPGESHMFFNVLLHFATLIAICIAFRKDIAEMLRALVSLFKKKDKNAPPDPAARLILLIIVATLPLLLVLPIKDFLESLSANPLVVAVALLITGCLLTFSDRMKRGRKTERSAPLLDALFVGVMQAIAVVPGLSRSGTTISAGLFQGFTRSFAVRFSFLMSLPAVLGASLLEFKDALEVGIDPALILPYAIGFVVAGVSGYFAIGLVRMLVDKGKFGGFAYYCFAIGLVMIGVVAYRTIMG